MCNKKQKCLMNKKDIFIFILAFSIEIFFNTQINAQTATVQGKVTTSRYPINGASITFIDYSDTTNKFTVTTDASGNFQISVPTSVNSNANNVPTKFKLEQSYPNPFSSSAAIPYQLQKSSDVHVTIYDILGRVVKEFNVGQQSFGLHNVLWNGRNNFGQKVASGIYFYRLQVNGESQVKKMIFDAGSKGMVSIPNMSISKSSAKKGMMKINMSAGIYKVRIENNSTTLPMVVPQEFDSVAVHNDTTIYFSVNYIPVDKINVDSLHQYIRGFGAANIVGWRPDMTDSEITTAFGTGEGQLGFTILRLRIQPDSTQWNLNVPTAKKAYDMGAIIVASPWNPPSDMLETVNGQQRLRHDMYSEYAKHLNDFYNYMERNGVPIYAISVQNEPDYAQTWTGWTPDEMLTFMKNNADTIQTRVMAPESFQYRRTYSDPILKDSAACANLDIMAGHIYGAGLSPYPLAEQKGKEIWMTEHYTDSQNSANEWPMALEVGTEMNYCMLDDMSAYIWWYIVRFYGPIGDGETSTSFPNESYAQKGQVTKRGYVMSQFSRFIRPGFHRVDSKIYPGISKVTASAFIDSTSSKFVIVAVNSGTTEQKAVFRIQNGSMNSTFATYTTSESKNCEKGNDITANEGTITFIMEPSSITTFVSK